MNVHGSLYSRNLKNIFLIFLVFCVITVCVIENGSKNFARTNHDFQPRTDTPLFPYDIRNYWFEQALGDVAIYILSAIGSDITDYVMYERDIRLHAWIDYRDKKNRIKCCFLWSDGTISKYNDPIVISRKRTRLIASQIACPINASHSDVRGVTALSVNSTCPSANDTLYIKPYLPKKANDDESFAMCLKLVYGNIDNNLLIDWLEFNRLIKVDKIFMFTFNISERTEAIIKHYVQIGFVETRPFNHPQVTRGNIGDKRTSYFEDERLIILDCLQRASGYKYISIIDMDEFLLPRKHGNVKELMKYLMKKKPNAAGFHLKSYIFVNNVEPDTHTPVNGSDIVKYFRRTRAMKGQIARQKNILLPSRISKDGLYTHKFKPTKNYTRSYVRISIAAINHYRKCYPNAEKRFCSGKLITDKSILTFVKRIPERTWDSET